MIDEQRHPYFIRARVPSSLSALPATRIPASGRPRLKRAFVRLADPFTATLIVAYEISSNPMTENEHALMIMMFTRQNEYIQMLLDMLKSNKIIQADDIPAFDFAVRNDPDSVALLHEVSGLYRAFAKRLGMETPKFPPTPAL
jgi:hypothetical protein